MKKNEIIRYSFLGLPLAFVGLPIYVNITDFYARNFAINLAEIAGLLLLVRLFDLLQDPFVGFISDKLSQKNISHKKIILISSSLLAISFFWLFNPPNFANAALIKIWFLFFLAATYSCFNFALINFETSVALAAENDHQRIAVNSVKELFGLIGILLAAAIPTLFASFDEQKSGYFWFSMLFAVLLATGLLLFKKLPERQKKAEIGQNFFEIIAEIWAHKNFLHFLAIFFFNALAVSIPASVVIFFINDVLKSPSKAGAFLALYFLSAAIFIKLWKNLAEKLGLVRSWSISIIGSITTFIFAYFVSNQNPDWFYLVCLFSGMFLGADLIMPPVIFAKLIQKNRDNSSSFVALWNLSNKSALMLASFVSLMILSFFGYQPGAESSDQAYRALSFVYAILPCLIKIFVVWMLQKFSVNNS